MYRQELSILFALRIIKKQDLPLSPRGIFPGFDVQLEGYNATGRDVVNIQFAALEGIDEIGETGVVSKDHDRRKLVFQLPDNGQDSFFVGMVKPLVGLDLVFIVLQYFADALGGRKCPFCGACQHQVGVNVFLFQAFAHAWRIAFTAVVERTVKIVLVGICPAGFGMTDNIQGFHAGI
jgi:hypothetical protein